MENKAIEKELKEIRQMVAKATFDVASNGATEHSATMVLVGLSDIADKIDILLSGMKTVTKEYPLDHVPLTDKERFWRGYR